jgi:iron-sulfur cluster assembly accessory protein
MITVTQEASKKIKYFLDASGIPNIFLRIAVNPGGCSGLKYQFFFDDKELDGDLINREYDGFEIRIDKMSMPYIEGAVVDFQDSIDKQGFTIDNPNAAGSCACGDSFH